MKLIIVGLMVVIAGCSDGRDSGESEQSTTPMVDGAAVNISNEDKPSKKGHLFSTLSADQEEDLALAINLSGNLCGKFVGAVPVGGMILAECQEYRKKEEHFVRYWIRGLGERQKLSAEKAFVLKRDGWQKVGR